MSNYQRFDLVRSGYDPNQVNNELDRLQSRINDLSEQILGYQSQIETMGRQFNTIRQRYQQLVSELAMRERAADDVARLALREANSVIETAQNNADDIIQESIVNAQNILREVNQYNQESQTIKINLKKAMQEYIEILNKYDVPAEPDLDSLIEKINSQND